MLYIRKEGEKIRQGVNFYPFSGEGSLGCQMLFGPLRVALRWSKRRKRLVVGMWLRTYAKPTGAEFIYIPEYTEFLEKCARSRFGDRPWKGVEPEGRSEGTR